MPKQPVNFSTLPST